MRAKIFLLTTLLAAAPATLPAQDGSARIEAAMQAAARAEIPVSLLESKVQEGRAKRVPEQRIAAAVETRLQALIRARETMRRADLETASAGELSVTADALEAGVSEDALVEIQRSAPRERRAVATAVLTSLVQLGVGSDRARGQVHAALRRGPEALANLRAEAAAQLRARGRIPPVDASAVMQGSGLIQLGGKPGS